MPNLGIKLLKQEDIISSTLLLNRPTTSLTELMSSTRTRMYPPHRHCRVVHLVAKNYLLTYAAVLTSYTLCGVWSVVIFCQAFFKCSTGRWADTAATVQPNWEPEFQKDSITKHHDRADATQCTKAQHSHQCQQKAVLDQMAHPVQDTTMLSMSA